MSTVAVVLLVLVGLLHLYFLVLEMFLWDKPAGLKAFGNTPEKAAATKVLAANQGLYNGFLAAGLLWGLFDHLPMLVNFMLGCVIVAGCYGAYSVNKRIFFIQAAPAILAVAMLNVVLMGFESTKRFTADRRIELGEWLASGVVGVPRVQALVASADVLVESYRPGVMARLGLDAATLRERYPRLV